MPHVVEVGKCEGGNDPAAGTTQAVRQIIVFAAPTDKAFVETVHGLEIISPDSEVVRDELRFFDVANYFVVAIFDSLKRETDSLSAADPMPIFSRGDRFSLDAIGHGAIEAQTIAGTDNVFVPSEKMLAKMIRRQEAIAIGEQKIGR